MAVPPEWTEQYANLLKLFDILEVTQKNTETLGFGLDAPALNETRNATAHLLRALRAENQTEADKELKKAQAHVQRAIYDCKEAYLLKKLEQIKVFQKEYALVSIAPVMPSYVEDCARLMKSIDFIGKCRMESTNRDSFYEAIQTHVSFVADFAHRCEASRGELNKKLKAQANADQRYQIGLLISIAALAVAFLTWR